MSLIREPKDIDFVVQSEPWSDEELADFRALMQKKKEERKAESDQKPLKKQPKQTT